MLEGIRERLFAHGFDPETTYRDWLLALQRILELSKATIGECEWSAPGHDQDELQAEADFQRVIDGINGTGAGNS